MVACKLPIPWRGQSQAEVESTRCFAATRLKQKVTQASYRQQQKASGSNGKQHRVRQYLLRHVATQSTTHFVLKLHMLASTGTLNMVHRYACKVKHQYTENNSNIDDFKELLTLQLFPNSYSKTQKCYRTPGTSCPFMSAYLCTSPCPFSEMPFSPPKELLVKGAGPNASFEMLLLSSLCTQ